MKVSAVRTSTRLPVVGLPPPTPVFFLRPPNQLTGAPCHRPSLVQSSSSRKKAPESSSLGAAHLYRNRPHQVPHRMHQPPRQTPSRATLTVALLLVFPSLGLSLSLSLQTSLSLLTWS
ncbi:hypothetical protein RJT34_12735 [Clitoria ternatea]|uniref:Uncharacterized protein n=1 Tax=Clitoria ternatea TaxID=43366 RepID=A0AAN9JPD3_CLITE